MNDESEFQYLVLGNKCIPSCFMEKSKPLKFSNSYHMELNHDPLKQNIDQFISN